MPKADLAVLEPPVEEVVWQGGDKDHVVEAAPSPRLRWGTRQVFARTAQATEFELLAEELSEVASVVSSTRRLVTHPAYLGILALGPCVIPLLLERLERGDNRPVWLRLLGSLTTFQPGAGADTIPEAAERWLRWARHGGHLPGSQA
jgi:hypothetical protein